MKIILTTLSTIAVLLLATSSVSFAYAEVPSWIKNNAGWWADGIINDEDFAMGIQYLVKNGIIIVN